MMKKLITIVITLSVFILNTNAQEKGTYTVGFESQMSLYGDSGLKTVELNIDLGYNITNHLSAWVRFEESIGLFNVSDTRNYKTSEVLGGVIGFNALKTDVGILTVKAAAGGTVGGNDWKYAYYQGGVYFNFTRHKIKPTLGFGVRYYDSNSSAFKNYCRFFTSIGFRFN